MKKYIKFFLFLFSPFILFLIIMGFFPKLPFLIFGPSNVWNFFIYFYGVFHPMATTILVFFGYTSFILIICALVLRLKHRNRKNKKAENKFLLISILSFVAISIVWFIVGISPSIYYISEQGVQLSCGFGGSCH